MKKVHIKKLMSLSKYWLYLTIIGNIMSCRFRLLISYFKFPNFGCFSETDIISDDSLEAVREVVTALRSNVQIIGQGWIFRGETALQRGIVLEIVLAIEKGNLRHLRNLLDSGWRLEASQALYTFLTRLSQPLIPHSIQSLVLDDNGHVPVEIVATDVLGLMKQELSDRHFQLVSILLNLLDTVIKVSPADELRGTTLPISMLPFFFNIQSQHINEWRRIATIFVELIRLASQRIEAGHASNVRVNPTEMFPRIVEMNLMPELVEIPENMIARWYLIPVGFRGDCNNLEVYERSNTNRILE